MLHGRQKAQGFHLCLQLEQGILTGIDRKPGELPRGDAGLEHQSPHV